MRIKGVYYGFRTSLDISLVPRPFINTTIDIYFKCVICHLQWILHFGTYLLLFAFRYSGCMIICFVSFFFGILLIALKFPFLKFIFLSAFLFHRNFFLLQRDSAYSVVALPYSVTLLEDKIPLSCQNIWKQTPLQICSHHNDNHWIPTTIATSGSGIYCWRS